MNGCSRCGKVGCMSQASSSAAASAAACSSCSWTSCSNCSWTSCSSCSRTSCSRKVPLAAVPLATVRFFRRDSASSSFVIRCRRLVASWMLSAHVRLVPIKAGSAQAGASSGCELTGWPAGWLAGWLGWLAGCLV